MQIKTANYLKLMIASLLAGHSMAAWAAGGDAGQLLNEQQRLQPQNQMQLNEEAPAEPELKFESGQVGDKVKVKSIQFQGAEKLSTEAQLQQWVTDAVGKELSFAQLQQLADYVTQQLRNSGYLLAKAYLPKQDVTDGVIKINIVQGQVDAVDGIAINGKNLRILEAQLQNILRQGVYPGQALNKQDLERSLLLINDLPGLNAQANIGSGKTTGSSKVTVNASEGRLLNGAVWADNFGNRYTGAWRGNGMLNINDPLKIGDQLRLSMTGSEGILLGSARYALPLMANGLNMDVHYSNLQYQLLDRYFPGGQFEGEANTVGTNINYPFIRSRALSLWGTVGYEHRDLRDKAAVGIVSDRQINEAVASLSANSLDGWFGGGISNARIGMAAGNLDRHDDAGDFQADQISAKSQGSFAKFTYSLARLQRLNEQLSFYGTINGQQASGNLDSSEKFILGGPSGIRAYPVGEASGDHGWVINTELRWDVPYASPIGNLQLVGFIDTGHISLHDETWNGAITNRTGKNNYQLSGGGISLNLTKNDSYQISGTWAAPIGDNPGRDSNGSNADGKHNDNIYWIQAMVWF